MALPLHRASSDPLDDEALGQDVEHRDWHRGQRGPSHQLTPQDDIVDHEVRERHWGGAFLLCGDIDEGDQQFVPGQG